MLLHILGWSLSPIWWELVSEQCTNPPGKSRTAPAFSRAPLGLRLHAVPSHGSTCSKGISGTAQSCAGAPVPRAPRAVSRKQRTALLFPQRPLKQLMLHWQLQLVGADPAEAELPFGCHFYFARKELHHPYRNCIQVGAFSDSRAILKQKERKEKSSTRSKTEWKFQGLKGTESLNFHNLFLQARVSIPQFLSC